MLTPSELELTTARAIGGDVASMRLLHLHYGVAVGDNKKAIGWLQRAAESGDAESQQDILCYYTMIRDTKMVGELEKRWNISSLCYPHNGT
jgi:TPR repeat protein